MQTSQKVIFGALVLAAVVAIVVIQRPPNSSPQSIVLGYVGPLSGDAATYGETEKNATELALTEINTEGKNKFTVEYEDGRCTAKDALTAVHKLLETIHPQVILGGTCSAETLAIAPATEQARVILFSSFSSNPQITNSGDYVFRNSPSDADIARVDAEKMLRDGRSRIAMISEETDYSIGVRQVMQEVFSEHNITPVIDTTYASTLASGDFRTILLKIKDTHPDALYINTGTSAKTSGLLARQAREIGMTTPLYSNFQIGTTDGRAAGGSALEGTIYSDTEPLSNKGTTVLQHYKERFHKEPSLEFAMATAYDRMHIIADAINAVGYDAKKIKEYLYHMPDYTGALGTYHFDKNGDEVGVTFGHKVIRNGKGVVTPE